MRVCMKCCHVWVYLGLVSADIYQYWQNRYIGIGCNTSADISADMSCRSNVLSIYCYVPEYQGCNIYIIKSLIMYLVLHNISLF